MKQLTVAVSSDSEADALVVELTKQITQSKFQMEISRTTPQWIELRFLGSHLIDHSNTLSWTDEVARLITAFIVNHMELLMIRKMLLKHHSYDDTELDEIMIYCKQLLIDTDLGLDSVNYSRSMWISNQLSIYIQTNSYLDIEGFVQFRLGKYIDDLQEVVDDACNEFVLNEQYQEFIALLKYFVYFQDTKIPEVHLIHQGNNKFQLLDENLKQLDISESSDVIVETIDSELNYEDMVVSALISASPKHIYIHTRDPEAQSIKTIQQIFEGRTLICTSCKLCKPSLGEWQAERLT
jgi:putative sporulation protein YtxC